jgi:hypothetical protein
VRRRPGYALLVTVLLLAAMAIAASGMLAIGAREREVATTLARRAGLRYAAESEVRRALAEWSSRRFGDLGDGEAAGWPADPDGLVTVTRLAGPLYLLQASVQRSGGPVPPTGHAAALVRVVEPGTLAATFHAAILAEIEAVVTGGSVAGEPDDGCAPGGDAPGILAPEAAIADGASVSGAPAVLPGPPLPVPLPGLFTPPLMDALVTVTTATTTVTPRPESGPDGCEPGATNWGATTGADPCHDLLPFVRATGPLVVRGGEGRGLLIAEDDLVLDGPRFHGVILARGRVTIEPGTEVRGAVRAGTVVMRGGSVTHSSCDVLAAFGAGGLDGPFHSAGRLWIPVFP